MLGRRDHGEAMRVAAGLTIFGHDVRLVFMSGPVAETEENAGHAELLELAEIVPATTVPEMGDYLEVLDTRALAQAMAASNQIINI